MVNAKILMEISPKTDEVVHLRNRCEVAEARVESLESLVKDKDILIKELKGKLATALLDSQKFMSAADTANARIRGFRASEASEIVTGLRPELSLLKQNSDKLSSLIKLCNGPPKGGVYCQSLDALTESIKAYKDNVTSNFNYLFDALGVKGIPDMASQGGARVEEFAAAGGESLVAGLSSVPVWSVTPKSVLSGQAASELNQIKGNFINKLCSGEHR